MRRVAVAAFIILLITSSMSFADTAQITLGLGYLSSSQNADGSWGGSASREGILPSTVSAIDAFKKLNHTDSSNYSSALSWLQNQQLDTTQYLAERMRVIATAGSDKDKLLSYLDGSSLAWGGYDDYTVSIIDTALTLQGLKALSYSDSTLIGHALNFLTANQNADGGWSFAKNGISNTYVTAIVLKTIHSYSSQFNLQSSIEMAKSYLLSRQNNDGGFGSSPSTVYETALAYTALADVTTDNTVLGNAVNYVSVNQASDGSWNQDPYSTALALQALRIAETRPIPKPTPTTGTVSGAIVDGSTNQPLVSVSITLQDGGGQVIASGLSLADGTFSIANIPAGSYQVSFSLTGYSLASTSVSVTAGTIVNIGNILLPTLPTTGIVQGTITDASSGTPLSGVVVTITGASAWTASTIQDGSFRITDITPGTVSLSAAKPGYYTITGTGTVAAGSVMTFSPALSTAPTASTTGAMKGTVTDTSTSSAINGATITITPAPSGVGTISTDAFGMFIVQDLDPGAYIVTVSAQNYTSQIYTATILAGSTLNFGSIKLAPEASNITLSGTVTDALTGQPIAGADVRASFGEMYIGATTDSSGFYTLTVTSHMEFPLVAFAEGYDSNGYSLVYRSPGSYTVNVSLSPSVTTMVKITSLTADAKHYAAYSAATFTAVIQNLSDQTGTGTVGFMVQSLQDQTIDYVQAVSIDENGAAQTTFNFQPGSSVAVSVTWNTKNLPPGPYAVIAKVMGGSGGIEGGMSIAAEGSTSIIIDPTAAILSFDVSQAPRYANFGASEQITLLASLANRSNIPTALGIRYEWRSPSGMTLHSGTRAIELTPQEDSKAVTLETFPFTFAESGDHQLFVTVQTGPMPSSLTTGMISVAPQVRIEPSQSISPGIVVPDGDKRIRMQIRVKGVEQK